MDMWLLRWKSDGLKCLEITIKSVNYKQEYHNNNNK